jgi:hypothetical protein
MRIPGTGGFLRSIFAVGGLITIGLPLAIGLLRTMGLLLTAVRGPEDQGDFRKRFSTRLYTCSPASHPLL